MKLNLIRQAAWAMAMTATHLTAQTFTTLHSFTAAVAPSYINSDGANPATGLILSGNTLYGTAYLGGSSSNGTVFAVNTDGTGFITLHSFKATFGSEGILGSGTNSDGASPEAGLILSGNTLYGTATEGGSSGNGTLFAVNKDGTGFTTLYSFTRTFGTKGVFGSNSDGACPEAPLILSGGTLYGTASAGGNSGTGTVFAIDTNGSGFTNIHSFTSGSGNADFYTNSDGAYPTAGLILSGNTLNGTTAEGGSLGEGTAFAVNVDGTDFSTLCTFDGSDDNSYSKAGLCLSGKTLYGATSGPGQTGGTLFAVNTQGTHFTNFYTFPPAPAPHYENTGGASPEAGLILSGNTLYGTATEGGSSGKGTVFAVNTDGTGFTTLHSFTATVGTEGVYGANSDGASPEAGLILSGNTLYGTAFAGGSSGNGTVFSLSFPPPQLTISASDSNVILTWPADAAGFSYAVYTLQATTNFGSFAVWTLVVPGPVLVDGRFIVTNPISGTHQFYRLGQ